MLLFLSGVTVNKQPSAAAATQHKERTTPKSLRRSNYQEKSTSKRCRWLDESRRSAWTFLRL